jgi:cytochrome P450
MPLAFDLAADGPQVRFARLAQPSAAALGHIPGPTRRPSHILETIRFFRDPIGTTRRNYDLYGPIYRRTDRGGWSLTLIGPEANELVLANREKLFSSEQGWFPILKHIAPRGLMAMDDPEHRVHRRLVSVAFTSEALAHYLDILQARMAERVARLPGTFAFYPAIKSLMLDLAASTLLGVPWGDEAARINRAFTDLVGATVAIVRYPLPGTALARGIKGREYLNDFFTREISRRRGRPERDFFTLFSNARDEEGGAVLTETQIVDHMNFVMTAAHDTLSSSLTSTIFFIARNPEWQRWLQEEIDAVESLDYSALARLPRCEMAFREAMRLHPPVPTIPRRVLRDVVIGGQGVPAGTRVSLSTLMTHRLADVWHDPDSFDPTRFSPEASRARHKFAWTPFGGGAHTCIGMQLSYVQAKVFLWHLLRRHSVALASTQELPFSLFPLPRPADGLPVALSSRG